MAEVSVRIDPETAKNVQYQLMLLLHVQECQFDQNVANGKDLHKCFLQLCPMIKEVVKHMECCSAGNICSYNYCVSSKRISSHWRNCHSKTCCVCLPFRRKKQVLTHQKHLEPTVQDQAEVSTRESNFETMLAAETRPEKLKSIQFQLIYLLHAYKCMRRDKAEGVDRQKCNLPQCRIFKEVVDHMVTCVAGKTCIFPECASSTEIISHWKRCRLASCCVCSPLKHHARTSAWSQKNTIDPVPQVCVSESHATNSDPKCATSTLTEKQKLVQDQLLILLHAQECRSGENVSNVEASRMCAVTHCSIFKKLLTHVKICHSVKDCTFPYCSSSRQLLAHWESCISENCLVCVIL